MASQTLHGLSSLTTLNLNAGLQNNIEGVKEEEQIPAPEGFVDQSAKETEEVIEVTDSESVTMEDTTDTSNTQEATMATEATETLTTETLEQTLAQEAQEESIPSVPEITETESTGVADAEDISFTDSVTVENIESTTEVISDQEPIPTDEAPADQPAEQPIDQPKVAVVSRADTEKVRKETKEKAPVNPLLMAPINKSNIDNRGVEAGRRPDNSMGDVIIVRSKILNYSLDQAFQDYFTKNYQLFEDYNISGDYVKGSKTEAFWEEGGSDVHSNSGYAVLLAKADGTKPDAVMVYTPNVYDSHRKKIVVNGKHALLLVNKGDFIVGACRQQGQSIIIVLKIQDSFVHTTKGDKEFPHFKCKLVAYKSGNDPMAYVGNDQSVPAIINDNSPVIRSAIVRMNEPDARTAIYAAPYRTRNLHVSDFNSCIQDPELTSNIKVFDTLEETYAETERMAIENQLKTDAHQQSHVYMALKAVPNCPDFPEGAIALFTIAVRFDDQKDTSQGMRTLMTRCILKPGTDFYYIDNPDVKISFEDLQKTLLEHNGSLASAVRRMTIL